MYFNPEMSLETLVFWACLIVQVALVQLLALFYYYPHRFRMHSDTFLCAVTAMFVLSMAAADLCNTLVNLRKREVSSCKSCKLGDDARIVRSHREFDCSRSSLLLTLTCVAALVTCLFSTRTNRCLVVTMVPPLYVALGFPLYQPNRTADLLQQAFMLCIIVALLWVSARQREIQSRAEWWAFRELHELGQEDEADREMIVQAHAHEMFQAEIWQTSLETKKEM
jgi:hypothetical protein